MDKLKPYRPLLLLLAIPALSVIYILLNHADETGTWYLITDLDRLLPFVPVFAVPYMLWYPYLFTVFVVLFVHQKSLYYKTLFAMCAGMVVCYVIFAFFQTTVSRPDAHGDGLLLWMVRTIYANDQPFNCFPSIHVLTSYTVMKSALQLPIKRSFKAAIAAGACLIIASTVLIKQHALLDAAGAVMLMELLFLLAAAYGKLFRPKTTRSSESRLRG